MSYHISFYSNPLRTNPTSHVAVGLKEKKKKKGFVDKLVRKGMNESVQNNHEGAM